MAQYHTLITVIIKSANLLVTKEEHEIMYIQTYEVKKTLY